MITESDQLSHALDLAASHWPELAGERAALLRKVISLGISAVESQSEATKRLKMAALAEANAMFSGVWAGFQEERLAEWPD